MKRHLAVFTLILVCLTLVLPCAAAEKQSRAVPVLMYHSVDYMGGKYCVTPEKLRGDILSLQQEGYTPVSFDDVLAFVYEGGPLPAKPVILTFDDGYKNNYDTLLPIAMEVGFPFEVFGIAGFMEYSPLSMTWEEARHMEFTGFGNIGCHTFDLHYDTPMRRGVKRNPEEDFRTWEHLFRTDLVRARQFLQGNLSKHPLIFAYPFGSFSGEADQILRESGYKVSVTTEPGVNIVTQGNADSLYLMMRISMDGETVSAAEMIQKYENVHTSAAILSAKENRKGEKLVSRSMALSALFTDDFKDLKADESYLKRYTDTKYLDADTARLLSLCISTCKISGFADYTIRPDHYITRGEFAVILARHSGFDGRPVTRQYNDTADWNRELVSFCAEAGLMQGYGDGYFGVNDFLTKEQLQLICERIEKRE